MRSFDLFSVKSSPNEVQSTGTEDSQRRYSMGANTPEAKIAIEEKYNSKQPANDRRDMSAGKRRRDKSASAADRRNTKDNCRQQ